MQLITRISRLAGALALAFTLPATATADDAMAKEREAIAKTAQSFIAAFGKEDAKAIANLWTPDGDYIDLNGRRIVGRDAIAADFAHLFAENDGLTVRIEVRSLQFPTADTAIEDGVTSVMSPTGLPNRAAYTNVMVKKNGQWLLASVREQPFVPPSNYEHLRPLEWVIGEWVEDTKEPRVSRVLFDFTPDKNFIVAARAVTVGGAVLDNGTQRIGWDPSSKILRTWSFEPDGGFGHGAWTMDGDSKWLIRMSSVLASGSLMTSTTVVTRVDGETITAQTKEIVIDGKSQPDGPVMTMRRVN